LREELKKAIKWENLATSVVPEIVINGQQMSMEYSRKKHSAFDRHHVAYRLHQHQPVDDYRAQKARQAGDPR
jgi:hypothetical protein